MELERVIYEVEDRLAIIKINYPPANTLGKKTLEDLNIAIDRALDDEKVKAVVLTGEGKMFVAGADLKELNTISTKEVGERTARAGQMLFNKIEKMDKPVIAAINGACLGGGMELAMACHIRIASETAKFGQPEINLGLIPGFGGTQRLARLTNRGLALEWLLTGDLFSAEEAYRIGIVNHVLPLNEVIGKAKAIARKISQKSSFAISRIIEATDFGLNINEEDGLKKEALLFGEVCATEDKKEGVLAFLEKRAPNFKDK